MTDFEQAKLYFKNATPATEEVKRFYDMAYHSLLFAEDFVGIDLEKMKKSMALYDVFYSIFTDKSGENTTVQEIKEKLKNFIN